MTTESIERAWDAEADVERVLAELRDALERMRSLGTLVRLCSGCSAIRDEGGAWVALEEYLAARLRVRFSHGLCEGSPPRSACARRSACGVATTARAASTR